MDGILFCYIAVDCEVSGWSGWSSCSQNCGGGTQSRDRSIVVAPENGGAGCPTLSQTQNCNTQACPVYGCTDSNALNYNAAATNNDGSCGNNF